VWPAGIDAAGKSDADADARPECALWRKHRDALHLAGPLKDLRGSKWPAWLKIDGNGPSAGCAVSNPPDLNRKQRTSVTFTEAVRSGFSKYANFSGRACRSEYVYWWVFWAVVMASAIVCDVCLFPDKVQAWLVHRRTPFPWLAGPITALTTLGLFLPSLAIEIRRLHDIDRRGWWVVIKLYPPFWIIITLILLFTKGTQGPNRYGPDPIASGSDPVVEGGEAGEVVGQAPGRVEDDKA
jgi:uncharacterized membrane protein YhaH (DUF805 family)